MRSHIPRLDRAPVEARYCCLNRDLIVNALGPTALIGFGSAFCFRWLLHRQVELLRMLERVWALNLILAIDPSRSVWRSSV
ncbi:MAG: hypothetical protein WAL59_22165 [Roseiarcus sp.]